jgi:PII-like signaling protein/nucleotide-binding universal stress UspA family protein
MFRKVLAVLDTTPGCRLAVEYSVAFARQAHAELHMAAVVALPAVPGEMDEVLDLEETGRGEMIPVVRTAREYAEGRGQPVTTEILVGPPADAIIRLIGSGGFDLVVIGQAGEDLASEWRQVARRAPCPVFVARDTVLEKFEGPPEHKTAHWEIRRDRRERIEGPGRMMRVFVGENDHIDGRPVYELIVQRLRAIDVAGATVYRGILGYGAAGRVHRSSHLPWSHDLPMVVTAVDTADAIDRAVEAIEDLVTSGLIVCSNVEIVKYSHAHEPSASPSG